MTPEFYEWFLAELLRALEGEGGVTPTTETALAPRADVTITAADGRVHQRVRNSNAFRRPGEALMTIEAAGSVWALGDDPRSLPPTPAARRRVVMGSEQLLPPPAFNSFAFQPELTAYYEEHVDFTFEYLTLFSKGLTPDAATGVADFPVEDAIREKLWRRRGKRGSQHPAWLEWDFITQEYPSESHPYQSGRDTTGAYVAGIKTQDWRHLTAADMPLFTDGEKLWLPDDHGAATWLGIGSTILGRLSIAAPIVNIDSGAGPVEWRLYPTVVDDLYEYDSKSMFGAATDFEQPVKRYHRTASTQVGTAEYEHRERAFNATGGDSLSEAGTFTLSAGDELTSIGLSPPWWDAPLFAGATVNGTQVGVTSVAVNFTSAPFRTFLEDNIVHVRFFHSGQPVAGIARVLNVYTDAGQTYIEVDQAVTVEDGMSVNRHNLAVPKSGSRTYYVTDDAAWTWEQYTLVQAHHLNTDANNLTYRVTPAHSVTLNRTLRLYEGSSSSGALLNEHVVTGVPAHGLVGSSTSTAAGFMTTAHGVDSGGPSVLIGGAQVIQDFNEPAPLTGDLPNCAFLHQLDGGPLVGPVRKYRCDLPLVMINYKPIPADANAGIQPSDYVLLANRFDHEYREPWFHYAQEANPTLYDGQYGTLHNPAGQSQESTWCGLQFNSRWYCADALTIDDNLIGVVLLDDLTLLVSVNDTPAWSGSVFDLLPACSDGINVIHREEGAPETWPFDRNPHWTVAPHYNFLHPNWPFPMALVGPFAVRARVRDDRSGINWKEGVSMPPIAVYPII